MASHRRRRLARLAIPPKTLALLAAGKRAGPAISTVCDHIHQHEGAEPALSATVSQLDRHGHKVDGIRHLYTGFLTFQKGSPTDEFTLGNGAPASSGGTLGDGASASSGKGTDQIRVEIHAKASVGGLGCS